MHIPKDSHTWQKVPFIGTYIGVKEIVRGAEDLRNISKQNKVNLAAGEALAPKEALKQAKSRILRGSVSIIPVLGGIILAIYDKCIKKTEKAIPFPQILRQPKIDTKTACENLRKPELMKIFDLEIKKNRFNNPATESFREIISKSQQALQEKIKKIPNSKDKKELKMLKEAWISTLGKMDCNILGKLNFTDDNIQMLGFPILEEAWIASLNHAQLGNYNIEVTRDCRGISDISIAACFSVLAKYPKLKSGEKKQEINLIEIKDSKEFSTSTACQSLANLLAANRKDLYGLQLPRVGINSERAKEIAQGMKDNTHIYFLTMADNTDLGDEGAKAILDSLHVSFHHPKHSKTFVLDMRSCKIGDNCIDTIIDLVKKCPNEIRFDLTGGNNFTKEGKNRLTEKINELNQNRENKININ